MALLQRIKKNPKHFLLIAITAPAIYGLIIPVVVADVFVSLYQAMCFPVYQIPKVNRREYLALDRGKLSYLTLMQKINCLYCDYANGVFAYACEVAGRTEWYWCPIKHPDNVKRAHDHYDAFIDYDDGESFPKKHKARRQACRACESSCSPSE
ncbi:hypothetical protein [Candidatus Thalassolituus haligoni]|uniref:hypothetical protein n=1 Tax=Candidatus Thalassolituus haligoni TaxID=3100113 RepID=UPI0035129585|tara:strand:- start:1951 stop:2409 length:459 start_codon:yes stop_codon:yes gene_type:complete